MKKAALGSFIVLDLLAISSAGFFLINHIQQRRSAPVFVPIKAVPSPAPVVASSALPGEKPTSSPITVAPAANPGVTRNIGFTYRNPHAKNVSIRADFTGWKAEPMKKGDNGVWTYVSPLSPGEYAYCFTADDKTFKDPANKRTKQIGRTLVSAIVVELPAPKKVQ